MSRRLAVVGLNWEEVQPEDLLLLFQQFARQHNKRPEHSFVERVEVFLSDFGKEKIKHEATKGPAIVSIVVA